jgi:hypothetical protein
MRSAYRIPMAGICVLAAGLAAIAAAPCLPHVSRLPWNWRH